MIISVVDANITTNYILQSRGREIDVYCPDPKIIIECASKTPLDFSKCFKNSEDKSIDYNLHYMDVQIKKVSSIFRALEILDNELSIFHHGSMFLLIIVQLI